MRLRIGYRIVCVWCVSLLALLAGCSPEYNWRELSVGDGMVRAVFPAKPDTAQRTLTFDGSEVVFTLTAATVDRQIFAVAYAPWPAGIKGDPVARDRMGRTVMASFYRNLGQPVPDVMPGFGQLFDVVGGDGKMRTHLRATIWLLPHALVEGMVSAPADAFPEEQARDFLRGLDVGRR